MDELHLMEKLVVAAKSFVVRRAHLKSSPGNGDELHAERIDDFFARLRAGRNGARQRGQR